MKKPKYDTLRVGIVCSRFNEFVVNALLDGAKRGLAARGVREKNIETHWVPGAFEIPLMARLMAEGPLPLRGRHALNTACRRRDHAADRLLVTIATRCACRIANQRPCPRPHDQRLTCT
ncbi:MAG: hypothetical protein EBT73_01570 [Actinobacteria bacterium]|nr:hypothetical protein [Actinomycetota bacterium]